MRGRVLLALASMLILAAPASTAGKAQPQTDWTRIVSGAPSGGFVLGNPNAKVKLVEYGSMTCPHCRAFDEEGVPTVVGQYVRSGKVSWEFRNYVRDTADLTASLIARCNGARGFFPLTRALFRDQASWFGKALAAPKDELERVDDLPPQQQFAEMAKITGLDSWAAAHGLPAAKVNQCLTNVGGVNQLVQMAGAATDEHPDFKGTPTFLINGAMVQGAYDWSSLEPHLRAAVGG